jgi:hypothetical protein
MTNRWIAIAAFVAVSSMSGGAQEKPAAEPMPPKPAAAAAAPPTAVSPVPLKVTVVLSRYHADKKTSSLPYVLGVTANAQRTTMRMGVEVPIVVSAKKDPSIPHSFNYRSVGTNIDCLAQSAPGGQYTLVVTVDDSSVHMPPGQNPGSALVAEDIPSFRTFKVSFATVMRDGQTIQHTSATDPVTGEVMKVDLTLNVVK